MPRKKKTTKTNAIISAMDKVSPTFPIMDMLTMAGLVALMLVMMYLL